MIISFSLSLSLSLPCLLIYKFPTILLIVIPVKIIIVLLIVRSVWFVDVAVHDDLQALERLLARRERRFKEKWKVKRYSSVSGHFYDSFCSFHFGV